MQFHIMLLFDVLYGKHRQIVALFSTANELVDSIIHSLDYLLRLLLMGGQYLQNHFFHTIHIELCMFYIWLTLFHHNTIVFVYAGNSCQRMVVDMMVAQKLATLCKTLLHQVAHTYNLRSRLTA